MYVDTYERTYVCINTCMYGFKNVWMFTNMFVCVPKFCGDNDFITQLLSYIK